MASYVVGIANHTGWLEHFILWELPLSRGLQYQFAILSMNGAKLVPSVQGFEALMEDIHG